MRKNHYHRLAGWTLHDLEPANQNGKSATIQVIDEIRKNGVALCKSVVAVVAVLLMGIGLVGYKYSVHRDSSKLKSEEPVTLSPDEVAGSGAAPARASVQTSSGDQITTFDMSTAVGLDDKPINPTIPVESISARPISKHVSKADTDGI